MQLHASIFPDQGGLFLHQLFVKLVCLIPHFGVSAFSNGRKNVICKERCAFSEFIRQEQLQSKSKPVFPDLSANFYKPLLLVHANLCGQ